MNIKDYMNKENRENKFLQKCLDGQFENTYQQADFAAKKRLNIVSEGEFSELDLEKIIEDATSSLLNTLEPRKKAVLQRRKGIAPYQAQTLEEVGREFNITSPRVRQIEAKAYRELKEVVKTKEFNNSLEKNIAVRYLRNNPELAASLYAELIDLTDANQYLTNAVSEFAKKLGSGNFDNSIYLSRAVQADKFLNAELENLKDQMNIRTYICLKNSGFKTAADIIRHTEKDLLKTRNFGIKSLNELKELLAKNGLKLRG